MQIIFKDIPFKSRKERFFYLVPLGDIHFGNPNCDVDLFLQTRDYIKNTPNCFWIGMGDYGDAIGINDKRFDLRSIDFNYATPYLQYRWITKELKEIQDKCLGLLTGNHDSVHWKKHGHDYVDQLAYDMEVPYLMDLGYLRLQFSRENGSTSTINLLAEHGNGTSKETGAKVGRIEEMCEKFPGLDLYLMGHVHLRGSSPPKTQLFVNKSLRVTSYEMNFVFTGCFLKGYQEGSTSYIEELGLKPTTLGSPLIKIEVEPGIGGLFDKPLITHSVVPYNGKESEVKDVQT